MKLNKKGFTLAEVLITLSIIGVIAAILFPSILANYNERTLKAKRQVLFGRMSQAMGEMADQFRNYANTECEDPNDLTTCTDKGSALKFINEGLSKVYKIAAVCDADSLSACDIPEEVTREDGTSFPLREKGATFEDYCPQANPVDASSHYFSLKGAGFMTKNGESILLFYNPNCESKSSYLGDRVYTDRVMCANIVYDLNGGKKKPNRVGEDIGYMSVFFNDTPSVATARPYNWHTAKDYETTTNSSGDEVVGNYVPVTYEEAKAICSSLGDTVGLPSYEEAMTMQINRELWSPLEEQQGGIVGTKPRNGTWIWTNTVNSTGHMWMIHLASKEFSNPRLGAGQWDYTIPRGDLTYRCVYTD